MHVRCTKYGVQLDPFRKGFGTDQTVRSRGQLLLGPIELHSCTEDPDQRVSVSHQKIVSCVEPLVLHQTHLPVKMTYENLCWICKRDLELREIGGVVS